MTRASASRVKRRRSKVVPMKGKKGLRLTELERVKLDNCLLRIQVIQEEANKRATVVENIKSLLMVSIGQRLKIPMDAYQVDLDTGIVMPKNGEPEIEEQTDRPADTDEVASKSGGGG